MELNAKLASLEDEIKILKGEVKLILSEIRTAILGQDNPFADPGQALRANAGAVDSRPPIHVVRVPSLDEEPEPLPVVPPPSVVTASPSPADALWDDDLDGPTAQPEPVAQPRQSRPPEEASPPPPPPISIAPEMARAPEPAPVFTPPAPPAADATRWSLLTIAGLAVWAEDALKQIGSERLQVLLDLCEFTGYLSGEAKEALLRITSLGQPAAEPSTPPSVNECLVVLCQLDALMRGEEPTGRQFSNLAEKWQKLA